MNVLLIDDSEHALEAVAAATSSLGHNVEMTTDPDEFRDNRRDKKPDLQIVDHVLPHPENQSDPRDGPELVAVTAAESENVPTLFLTNFKPDCRERVAELDPRLAYTIVEKPSDTSPQQWTEAVRHGIDELTSRHDPPKSDRLGVPTSDLETDFFRLLPAAFYELDEDRRDAMESEAAFDVYEHLDPIWNACDDDWLLLQSVGSTVIVTDRGVDGDLPTDDSVRDTEFTRGAPALLVGRPAMVEEIGPIDCSPSGVLKNWRKYPVVRLIVSEDERDFHLDTGSADSFISREYLGSLINLPPARAKRTIVSDITGRKDAQAQTPVDVELHVSGPHGNVPLAMQLQSVKNWGNAMLNPKCDGQKCPKSSDLQCGRRMGLIGRDLLYQFNEGLWTFEPGSGRFYPSS